MIHEQTFICWHENQVEGDGKELKASSIRNAAKKAVDIWRHENMAEIHHKKVTVYVKDESRKVHQVVIIDEGATPESPEAFL